MCAESYLYKNAASKHQHKLNPYQNTNVKLTREYETNRAATKKK